LTQQVHWLDFNKGILLLEMHGTNLKKMKGIRLLLCCSMYFCVVLCIVCFVSFSILFVCKWVLNYCHRVATQLQLPNI
jgi:hypothetical protein